jgi:hypothetical protein
MWFEGIVEIEKPGRGELKQFTRGVEAFLGFVLNEREGDFAFLWADEPELWPLARDTYKLDVSREAERMRSAIADIPDETLDQHGLRNRPLHFKFRVLNSIANRWRWIQEQYKAGTWRRMLAAREWLKKIVDAIDAVLDSLMHAATGWGGVVKEFKDALRALA